MYIKITNGSPTFYSIGQLRRDNPNTSFPKKPSDSLLAEWNVYPVKVLPKPDYDERTHYLKQSEFYQVDDKWQVHYSPEKRPKAQVEETIRSERDRLLEESDWIVAKSYEMQIPVPQKWVDYRQSLRDLPQQANFPFNVIYPQKP